MAHAKECQRNRTLCSDTLISEGSRDASYVKHRVYGPRQISCNTHRFPIEWKSKTGLRCMHDHHTFAGQPVGLPVSYNKKTKEFTITNIFCGLSCALAKLFEEQNEYNFSNRLSMFTLMAREIYGYHDTIYPAGDCRRLIEYGGDQTIKEYRLSHATVSCIVIQPPFIGFSMVFEEINHNKKQDEEEPCAEATNDADTDADNTSDSDDNDFNLVASYDLKTKPSDTLNWKIRGLRIPAREKEENPSSAEDPTFTQSVSLYQEYLTKKNNTTASEETVSVPNPKRRRTTAAAAHKNKKSEPITGTMMQFITNTRR